MKLAISTWSFQQRLASGAMTQMDCISKAKELGADAIEFVDVLPPAGVSREDYARQLGEACKEQGLGVSNYTIGADFLANDVQDEVDRIAKELELALLLGATSIRHDVTGGIPGPARATTGFEQVARPPGRRLPRRNRARRSQRHRHHGGKPRFLLSGR